MMEIPYECPRKQKNCVALSNIVSDNKETFFCCGEHNGNMCPVKQDRYTICFKGPHRDDMAFYDKRDLVHESAVIMRALAVIEKEENEAGDWSPWS